MAIQSFRPVFALLCGLGAAGLSAFPDAARAASCWCDVVCSLPGGAPPVSKGNSWSDGNYPFSGKQWSDCNANCTNYLFGLDLEAIARERNVCGTVECTSKYRLGARPERDGQNRTAQVACLPPNGSDNKSDSQYAAKFVCGPARTERLVEPGDYKTTINIHNPSYQTVGFRYKTALADLQKDGARSNFVDSNIGPDGAQAFDCDYIRKLSGSGSGLIDGFFVIESKAPLDVAGYYTSSNPAQNVTSIHIEKIAGNAIPAHSPLCKTDLKIDLANVQNWVTATNSQAVPVTSPNPNWDTNGRAWMSYANDGDAGTSRNFTYQLDFCSCSPGRIQATGNVKSDNAAHGELNYVDVNNAPQSPGIFDTGTPPNGSLSGDGNFRITDNAVPITGFPVDVGAGSGNISITVHNGSGPTGISLIGTVTLPDGYLGPCRQ